MEAAHIKGNFNTQALAVGFQPRRGSDARAPPHSELLHQRLALPLTPLRPASPPPPQLARVHEPFAADFSRSEPHALPRLRVPPVHPALNPATFASALAAYPPCPQLRILPTQMSEGSREPVERFVVEELLADTIWAWEDGNRQGTRHIVADQLAADNQPMDFPYDGMLAEAVRFVCFRSGRGCVFVCACVGRVWGACGGGGAAAAGGGGGRRC